MTAQRTEDPRASDMAAGQPGPDARAQPRVTVVVEGMPRTAKVIRLGVMARELLLELRGAVLDEGGRARMRNAFEASVGELSGCLPPHLSAELDRLSAHLTVAAPSQAELRIAQAQLTGWLDGLVESVQVTIDAQRTAALQRLAEMGAGGRPDRPEPAASRRPDPSYL
jgi:hypothetical protein